MMRIAGGFVPLVLAMVSGLTLVALAALEPDATLRGWHAAFVWSTVIPVGSLALLLAHRITGGEWGEALRPLLEPAAKGIVVPAAAAIPVLLFSARIYNASPAEGPAYIAQTYMSAPLFALRTIAALCFWSVFAWLKGPRTTALGAAIGLIGAGVVTNVVPVDWVIATGPGFHSSAFGFGFLIEQMLSALALAALLGPQGEEPRECRDLAGLIIATLLGLIYFVYVEFAIIWYGDLPPKADWYAVRSESPWGAIVAAAFAAGAAVPFAILLNDGARASLSVLRLVGALILLAIALHMIWLVVPSFGVASLLPAALGIVFLGALFVLWLGRCGLNWAAGATFSPAARHG